LHSFVTSNNAFAEAVTDKNVVIAVERIREHSSILWDMVNKGQIGYELSAIL
jgi:uncharacterized OB-fold protein